MAKQSPKQQETVERVMHEFKHGELEQSGGAKVKDPKQAIAIALREAGASNQETPRQNRANLRKTQSKERAGRTPREAKAGGATKAALYAEAKRRGLPGRSTLSKAQLAAALAR